MFSAELDIILLNLVLALVAYLSVYPALAGNDLNKIALYDLGTSGIALGIVGYHYWGSEVQFNILLADVNWFWFTLISYAAIEFPMMLWYFKKHGVKMK
ncbi:hypothetical protein [Undibacterium fentianense]|uniref:Uncharacterized protein n=1 Tax=Undibacterium fentianense TaxID=2828728 RepID=A0A941E168_9BURK|nr:hypothetical protein [Undibacterium fentianense]MBR7800515.1 hypothetical protein [Undibacterium fentianense]